MLLRGINVGGHNRVAMAELRSLMVELGFDDVASYIQSGNVAFNAVKPPDSGHLAEHIAEAFHVDVPVVVLPRSLVETIGDRSPFGDVDIDEKFIHIMFLDAEPNERLAAEFPHDRYLPDKVQIDGRAAHILYPNGSGRSKLTIGVVERALQVTATGRNLKTVRQLATL